MLENYYQNKTAREMYGGIEKHATEYKNLSRSQLIEKAVLNKEGNLTSTGGFATITGQHTGRSPKDKFIVDEPSTAEDIAWGDVNKKISEKAFDQLHKKFIQYFEDKDLYVQDALAGADPTYQIKVRVVTAEAWHNLFAQNMFIKNEIQSEFIPDFVVLQAPDIKADPKVDETYSETFIVVNYAKRLVLIGGTNYAGEIKKSIFSVLNYYLPKEKVMAMHCSTNISEDKQVALFFGLSGTGKTTLSSDPDRKLIGDDEHGWGNDGVFNFEGGCYAKAIHLDKDQEPLIYDAAHQYGAILENVVIDPVTRVVDFDDSKYTQNTRVSYPMEFFPHKIDSGMGGHPEHVFFLTADAFGVLPPISKLTSDQAMYYFLSGYTAKVAGTEKGLGKEPQATFSSCFGDPFLPLHPVAYADLLGEKIQKHNAQVWLINTGWVGGAYGVGSRIKLKYTRRMVHAALNGELANTEYSDSNAFGLFVPQNMEGVPSDVLNPKSSWADAVSYDKTADNLIGRFKENFKKYHDRVSEQVTASGPK
jgi:phosphoenolpyruvate carboxykinase (ATP)